MRRPNNDVGVNRLIEETSPYLLQHARNPVDWYPWGHEALEKARREDKPIFLSIGYSACHWCHVMERESFENEEIAEILNRDFVAIKVDREERPDLDEIYMRSVQMMTGSGGWPLSIFLTPDLEPFFGGTYFPPDSRFGFPGFKRVLLQVANTWSQRRADVTASAERITEELRDLARQTHLESAITRKILDQAVNMLIGSFDQKWGGFGGPPKFPSAGAISLLLRQYAHTGNRNLLHAATFTLDRMACGGMYDQIGGGFHRYSVDRSWLVPHFEKMLYDNALLSTVYLEAYQMTKKPLYRRIAAETLDYVIREMTDESGGFHSTQDADSEGEEGKYYVWSRDEILKILGKQDGDFFCDYYGVAEGGNFDGTNILNVPISPSEFARNAGITERQLDRRLVSLRKKVLRRRSARVHPKKDDKVLASWNGMMISSLAKGYQVLGKERFLRAAERAGNFILASMVDDQGLYHTYRQGHARIAGYLDDYAHVACAMIDLYETSFETKWLEAADRLLGRMIEVFWDGENGGFFLTAVEHEQPLTRTKPYADGSVPSGNSIAAGALLRLGYLTGNTDYHTTAEQVLRGATPSIEANPMAFTHMLCTMDFYLSSVKEIAIVGEIGAADTGRMLETVRSGFLPNKVVALMDPQASGAANVRQRIPLLADKPIRYNKATAYVCENHACGAPVVNHDDLAGILYSAETTGKGGSGQ